jgi:PPM family protein phosphatase
MPIRITAVTKTDPGRVRERNEDSAYITVPAPPHDDTALLVVADGMGGYKAGDEASRIAVETIAAEMEPLFAPTSDQPTKRLSAAPEDERDTVVLPETEASQYYGGFITRAVHRANDQILAYGQEHREARGLGSTVTMVVVAGNRAYFANVGDSRTCLYRDRQLRAITRDHSLVAKLVEAGQIDPDDVYDHPKRNLIYRSLGTDRDEVEVDLFEEELFPGDILLLCSDGLWEKVRGPMVEAVLAAEDDLDVAATRLIQMANDAGGEDNITLVLARCTGTRDGDIADADTGESATVQGQ